jgi:hypothetical protein
MTLSTMTNNLNRYVPGINPDLLQSYIQDAYRQLCAIEWNALKVTKSIYTSAPYSTGTVSIDAAGTVTGVLTIWTAAMVGRYIKVHYDDALFTIATVTPPTTLTLSDWTGDIVAAGETYEIIQTIYPIPSDYKLVWDATYQTSMTKKSQTFFNYTDPSRSSSGSPTWWAYAGQSSTGVLQIEVYPVPDAVYPIKLYGKKKVSTLATTDSPILPEDLVEATALTQLYRLKIQQQPKSGWEELLAQHLEFVYNPLFIAFKEEDAEYDAHPDHVKDTFYQPDYPPSDSFRANHDVE